MTNVEIHKESVKRMSRIKVGEMVTNICASSDNPIKYTIFVRHEVIKNTNKHGLFFEDHKAKTTDANGTFFNIDIDVIYPGVLCKEECEKLYQPIWEAEYGTENSTIHSV